MDIIKFIMDNVEDTIDSIEDFALQPLKSLGQIFPVGMVCTSIISFIVALDMFILNGGFSNQVNAIKNDSSFESINHIFTNGTIGVLVSGIVSCIILLLFLAEIIVLIISYLKTEGKIKKIIAMTSLGIGLVLTVIPGFILAVIYRAIEVPETTKIGRASCRERV